VRRSFKTLRAKFQNLRRRQIAFTAKSLKFYASKSLKPSRLDKSVGQDRHSDHLLATKGEETKPLRSGANFTASSRNLSAKFLTDAP